jgi:hypothetical protein
MNLPDEKGPCENKARGLKYLRQPHEKIKIFCVRNYESIRKLNVFSFFQYQFMMNGKNAFSNHHFPLYYGNCLSGNQ